MKQALVVALLALSVRTFAADAAPTSAMPDLAKAQQIATQVCAACHGADGNSASPSYPSLAGQSAAYISTQLSYFKSGARKNPIMAGFAAALSADDMKNLGAYFEKQPLKPQAAKDKKLAEQGQKLFRGGNLDTGLSACMGCHGPNGAGVPNMYPHLAGQYADYTFAQ